MTRIKAATFFLRSSDAGRRRGFGRRAKCDEAVEQKTVYAQMDRLIVKTQRRRAA